MITVVVLVTVIGGGFSMVYVYRLLATAVAKVLAKVLEAGETATPPEVSVTAAAYGVIASAGNVGTVAGGLSATAASSYATTSLVNEAAAVPEALLPFAAPFNVVAAFAAAAAL